MMQRTEAGEQTFAPINAAEPAAALPPKAPQHAKQSHEDLSPVATRKLPNRSMIVMVACFRVLSALLAIAGFARSAPSQVLTSVGTYGTNIGTVAVDGAKGVINEATGIRVMTLSPFSSPSFRGIIDVGAVPGCLQVIGNYAYSAAETGKFTIINIANPDVPIIAGQLDWTDWKETLWVRRAADYAYVAGCAGIRVVDIRIKTAPVVVRTLSNTDCVYSLVGDGGYLYVGHSTAGDLITIYSLADPSNPVQIGSGPAVTANAFHMHNGLAVFGDTAYASEYDRLAVINIADRSAPSLSPSLAAEGGQTALSISRGILHAPNWDHTRFFTLASPTAPDTRPTISGTIGHEVSQTAADGDLGYSARVHSLWISDLIAGTVSQARSITPNFGVAEGLAISGNTLFVGTGPGISAFNISNPSSPVLLGQIASGWTGKLKCSGSYLYNASAWGYIEIFNISNPASLVRLSTTYTLPGASFDSNRLSINGSTMAVTSGNQIAIYTIAGTGLLTQYSTITLPTTANAVAHSGSTLYVALLDGTVRAYNISNLASPTLAATRTAFSGVTNGAFNTACELVGTRLHVLFARRGYAVFDVASPLNPTLLGTYGVTTLDAAGITADANYAYLAPFGWNGKMGVRVLSISNPSTIAEVVATEATNYVADVLLYNGYAYYAEERGGLRIRQAFTPAAGVADWSLF